MKIGMRTAIAAGAVATVFAFAPGRPVLASDFTDACVKGSGLFDEYPKLTIILGHLGEAIPHGIWRVDNRIRRSHLTLKAQRPLASYLHENFYITTSGNFRTQALTDVILEIGADRVLYSVDYPYEDVVEAQTWLDNCAISDADRIKIAGANARRLFRL